MPEATTPIPTTTRAHDFDFWVGEWDVFGPEGRQVGTSSITPLFGTGALAEHWQGSGEVEGRSLSSWDELRRCWHQTWVDSSGGVLMLDGHLLDGAMVMTGTAPGEGEGSAPEHQRITWTPQDGDVRQLWEASPDGGTTWRTAFDGRYVRRTA
jgi:hypothetical protein